MKTLIWYGDNIHEAAAGAIVSGLNEWGVRWETAAKGSVKPGRGVVTGTYRRSLHSAPPTHNFGSDNVKPSPSSPERGGEGGATAKKASVAISLGSGMVYAMFLERRYNVVMGAYERVAGQLPGILEKHARAAGFV